MSTTNIKVGNVIPSGGTFIPYTWPPSSGTITSNFTSWAQSFTPYVSSCISALDAYIAYVLANYGSPDNSSLDYSSDATLISKFQTAANAAWNALHYQNIASPCTSVAGAGDMSTLMSILGVIASGTSTNDVSLDADYFGGVLRFDAAQALENELSVFNSVWNNVVTYPDACEFDHANGRPPLGWVGPGNPGGVGGGTGGDDPPYQ